MSEPIETRITTARAELESALNEIEDRLNVPKQLNRLSRRAQAAYRANPLPWIAGATGAIIVIGGLVAWAIFSDD
ncbi:DUF3618 domain-containing protein [Lacisediminihabitans sp.]|uniref:DUF3618 domain-containing protein n=1 Tax=Lacisediminihabitans sp. TaxID=2787631 RepID=UPI00374CA836